MDEWEYHIAELKWRIEKLRQETGYYNKSSHPQPQKSVEKPKIEPQKSVEEIDAQEKRNAEMNDIKAKLMGRKLAK